MIPPRPDPQPDAGRGSWFVRRWRANGPLINFAACALMALGAANIVVGIILLTS